MSKPVQSADLDRNALRLLRALAAQGASPARLDLREGFIAVAHRRNGVTTIAASVPEAAGQALAARGLAVWRDGRLALDEPGRRLLARLDAPPGAEPFVAQHAALRRRAPAPGEASALIDESESPLAWLARRKGRDGAPFLDAAQLEAGERLRMDITLAQLAPRVTSDWSGLAVSGAAAPRELTFGERAIAARQRLDTAFAAVGADLTGLLIDVCGFQKKLEWIERERAWPARSAKVILKIALARLAAHYGLCVAAEGPAQAQMRRWGAPDYRPTL
ncbi:MAG: ATPase [Hyphomicrobiales bacterium]|nr:ATPase [Hyphomicrobiales bacterium]